MNYVANVTIDASSAAERNKEGVVTKEAVKRVFKPGDTVTGLEKSELDRLLDGGYIAGATADKDASDKDDAKAAKRG